MAGHAFLAPSSAHVWGKPGGCRAAPMLQALHPDREESDAAREGTAAHEVAATAVDHALRALSMPDGLEGQVAGNGVLITREMLDAVDVYASDIRQEAIARGVFGGEAIGVEQRLLSDRIHPQNGGTPDFFMHDARNRAVIIWDFKYGFDVVEAFENWQLMNYAALVLDHLGIDGNAEQWYTVVLKIVQPRAFKSGGPVDTWTVKATDLRPFWNDMHQGAVESMAPDAPARPASHCLNCSARHSCMALRVADGRVMDFARGCTAENLDNTAMSIELHWLQRGADLIEARRSGLEAEALHRVQSGDVVPGWAPKPRYGRRTWKNPDEVLGMGPAFGVDLRKNEPVSPSQAKAAGIPEEVVENFTYRPEGGFKLAPVKSNEARKVFTR